MRYRINEYTINGQEIALANEGYIKVEDVRLIVNETQGVVICSSMKKGNIRTHHDTIEVMPSVCTLQPTDVLTIEIDRGDSLAETAKEDTLAQGISSVESKVEEESVAIQRKIDNIDLSGVAKQGENIHATNTAIYESLKNSSGYIKMTNSEYDEFKAHIIEVTNNILN